MIPAGATAAARETAIALLAGLADMGEPVVALAGAGGLRVLWPLEEGGALVVTVLPSGSMLAVRREEAAEA